MGEHRRAVDAVPSVEEARALARELLEPLGNRWTHVQSVVARAEELRPAVESEEDQHMLIVAAWWHDLGYAPELRRTGCHQLDGARYLTGKNYSPRLCALVAHHSAATFEARERGLGDQLDAWLFEESPVADALWMADMTTGPAGQRLEYSDRLAEILNRYEPDSVVARAMRAAEPDIRGAISRTEQRLAAVHAI